MIININISIHMECDGKNDDGSACGKIGQLNQMTGDVEPLKLFEGHTVEYMVQQAKASGWLIRNGETLCSIHGPV